MEMFCNQCQEALRNEACTARGVCGKDPVVSNLQDALIYLLEGLSQVAVAARDQRVKAPEADRFVAEALFATITNTNFDAERLTDQCRQALEHREALRARMGDGGSGLTGPATWTPRELNQAELVSRAEVLLADRGKMDEDVLSLRELLLYGLKGMAAYVDHATVLGKGVDDLLAFIEEGLAAIADDSLGADGLVGWVMRCGEMGAQAMARLDEANTGALGHPQPTQVSLGVREGPAILVSGHDLRDLEELLRQTEGTGVNVYTHGEMLPAHGYPLLKKHPHLVGNYGGSWWRQNKEFGAFGGAILMTTNCLVPPRDTYLDRLFTTGPVAWPGVPHIPDREGERAKDFTPVIERALHCPGPQPLEEGTIPVGYAHQTLLSVADKVIEAVQAGAIKRFVVMAGCDGRHKDREYYTEVARSLPEDTVILTAGCAKYRYNKLDLGDIGGIPRILDAGQCNDSYSLVVAAQALQSALGLEDINDLPISYDIAWYEQKAVIVLLALLSLGVKHIRLGPTLPAFLSPGVAKVLVDRFDIMPIGTVEADVEAIMKGC